MTGEFEDVTEWAMSRYHWHQNGASAEALRQMVFRLAEKYDFTAEERVTLGNALQAFANALQNPSGKALNGPTPLCCSCWTGPAAQFNPPLCLQCIELAKRVLPFPIKDGLVAAVNSETISRLQREMGERCPRQRGDDCVYPECDCDRVP
jgi:hypothetical protein